MLLFRITAINRCFFFGVQKVSFRTLPHVTTCSYEVLQALAVIFVFNCCDKNIFFLSKI